MASQAVYGVNDEEEEEAICHQNTAIVGPKTSRFNAEDNNDEKLKEEIHRVVVCNKPRKNGMERPFSCFQVFSWVMTSFSLMIFLATVACYLEKFAEKAELRRSLWYAALSTAYLTSFTWMVWLTFKITMSDPSDPTVAIERRSRLEPCLAARRLIFNPDAY